jgi:basic membrane protein A
LRKSILIAALSALVLGFAIAAGAIASPKQETITAGLVSDVGRFNDKSFNQSQLEGLKRAEKELGVKGLPLQSNVVSDYIPNLTNAVRRGADIVVAAGFLLADATETVANKFPDSKFAITDYCATTPCVTGSVLKKKHANVMGLDYAANESGCLVGVLAAQMAKKMGGNIIGAVGGIKIPPVDIWIAGYRYCARLVVPGIQVLIGYSQDFVAADKCKTVAENQIAKGAKVLFQVAGGCGLGTLKAADDAGIWGIGVDKDQYNDAKRVLTSGVKRVDVGVYQVIKAVQDGTFKGGTNLLFNLKNGGMAVGKINPSVPKAFVTKMNAYKKLIISGERKIPTKV